MDAFQTEQEKQKHKTLGGLSATHSSLRSQIFSVNLLVVGLTILLTLLGTLYVTLKENRLAQDKNLMSSAQMIAHVPIIWESLENGVPTAAFTRFLDEAITQINDIDIIAIADTNNIQFYDPDPSFVGKPYEGQVQERILAGEDAFTSDDTGRTGAERCAYAPIESPTGELLGFVMVGVYMKSVTEDMTHHIISFLVIAICSIAIGLLLSFKLSARIKDSLMGYEPQDLLGMFHQREDVLEALEEGIIAIDDQGKVMYLNAAAAKLMGKEKEDLQGKAVEDIYEKASLQRILQSKRSEYNVPLVFLESERVLSDRMPIWSDGRVIGAVEIMRNRTEVTQLAKDLTGVRHMVDAMRAYTHEFMNKLHVILGLLHLGQIEKAESYIMDVTNIQREAVGAIMNAIENPSVAALLVGKTSHCTELGIRLTLGKGSYLRGDEHILPTDACVTILGNLIENAVEAMNAGVARNKEIMVSIQEESETLLICVEDTGPGMEAEVVRNIFQKGFTTKSTGRGTGLSLVNDVVNAYEGDIRVESKPSVGTTFVLNFHRIHRKGT